MSDYDYEEEGMLLTMKRLAVKLGLKLPPKA